MKNTKRTNRTLAAVALGLGVLSLLGNTGTSSRVTMDLDELAAIVESEADHITVQELAERIIAGATDYRLLDLREPEAYAAYHIPGAENVGITELTDYPLLRNEKVIMYSGGGIHASQAWFLLKAKKYPAVYTVLGGMNAWEDEILFPQLAADASPEAMAAFAKIQEVSRYFGGSPSVGGEASAAPADRVMPEVEMPAVPLVTTKKRTAREGC